MKIKTVKKMNVLELAQAVRDGEVERGTYKSSDNNDFSFFHTWCQLDGMHHFNYDELFEVETLEELTEETPIPCDIIIKFGAINSIKRYTGGSISSLKENREKLGSHLSYVYQQHPDGSIGRLIWSKENGFEDGVLEVEK